MAHFDFDCHFNFDLRLYRDVNKVIKRWVSLFSFLTLFSITAVNAQQQITIDQFMGINLFWADPIEDAQCVGFAREFHDWQTDQNNSDYNGPGKTGSASFASTYPSECYTFSPVHSGIVDFDYFYRKLIGNGMAVVPAMNNSIFPYTGYSDKSGIGGENKDGDNITFRVDPNTGRARLDDKGKMFYDTSSMITRKPVEWFWNPTKAAFETAKWVNLKESEPYVARANWVYNYMAKYGSGENVDAKQLKFCTTEDSDKIQQGLIQYIECWNEPTKWWNGPESQFSPEEYAAMANCDYDGDEGNILIEGTKTPMGFTHQYTHEQLNEKAVKFVMGAPHQIVNGPKCKTYSCDNKYKKFDPISQCDWNVWDHWILPMQKHLEYLRDDDAFIFDVINVHHYSFDGMVINGTWISPEQDELRAKLAWLRHKMVQHGWKDNVDPNDDLELWLSEFGYDTNELTHRNSNGPWFGPEVLVNGLTAENIQARWTIRAFLELAAAGVDRAILHDLTDSRDSKTNPVGAWDHHTGLLTNDGAPKEAWFYVYSMKNILAGYQFADDASSLNCDFTRCDADCGSSNKATRIYRFDHSTTDKTVWAVWSPTACPDFKEYNIDLRMKTDVKNATGLRLVSASTQGAAVTLKKNANGTFKIPVSETPMFIVEEALEAPVCPSVKSLSDKATCNSVTVEVKSAYNKKYDSYQIWYGPLSKIKNPAAPNFQALSGDVMHYGYGYSAEAKWYTVSGLSPNTEYAIYVIPETKGGIPPSPCYTVAKTSGTDIVCKIPLSAMTLKEIKGDKNGAIEIFDEQNLDFCSGVPTPSTQWIKWGGASSVKVTLDQPYHLNNFYVFDQSSSGLLQITWSEDGVIYKPLTEYYTNAFNKWVVLDDFKTPKEGIKYLMITATSDKTRLGELFICGYPL